MSNSNTTVSPDEDLTSPYNYVPTQSVCLIFLALFGVSTVLHFVAAVKFRMWWLLPTAVLAGIGEVVGWIGREWSSQDVLNQNPFLMQIVCTIIAPTPLLAANFIIFSRVIGRLGECYSRLTPRWYSRIFLTCDLIALTVQGAGGGIAASATTLAGSNNGGHIMLGGIVFQLVALIAFMILSTEFYVRYFTDRPVRQASFFGSSATLAKAPLTHKLKLQTYGLVLSSIFIFIRSIYRTIELSNGWNGVIISTQVYFNVFDGAMIVLAMYTLNVFHPGILLAEPSTAFDVEAYEAKKLSRSEDAITPLVSG